MVIVLYYPGVTVFYTHIESFFCWKMYTSGKKLFQNKIEFLNDQRKSTHWTVFLEVTIHKKTFFWSKIRFLNVSWASHHIECELLYNFWVSNLGKWFYNFVEINVRHIGEHSGNNFGPKIRKSSRCHQIARFDHVTLFETHIRHVICHMILHMNHF